ncbi:MAG TPA: pentapeptide repeat-containing protein [Desulfobacteria bacterium]|nr:pentapeptide repeat-containing protein [Desulfobacteria bacterium]
MSVPQKIVESPLSKERLLELLRTGDISAFNRIRKDLETIDLHEADLHGADLREAQYQDTKVEGANIQNAIINDRVFLGYLRVHGAKNVPDTIVG